MARLRWAPQAVSDLESICKYISQDSKEYASLFVRNVFDLIEEIQKFPKSGRIVPEYQRPDLRERILQNYRLVYRVSRKALEVVAIVHGARDFGKAARSRL